MSAEVGYESMFFADTFVLAMSDMQREDDLPFG